MCYLKCLHSGRLTSKDLLLAEPRDGLPFSCSLCALLWGSLPVAFCLIPDVALFCSANMGGPPCKIRTCNPFSSSKFWLQKHMLSASLVATSLSCILSNQDGVLNTYNVQQLCSNKQPCFPFLDIRNVCFSLK